MSSTRGAKCCLGCAGAMELELRFPRTQLDEVELDMHSGVTSPARLRRRGNFRGFGVVGVEERRDLSDAIVLSRCRVS